MDHWPDHPRRDTVAGFRVAQAAARDASRNGYHDNDNTTHRYHSRGRTRWEHDNTAEDAVSRSIESSTSQRATCYTANHEGQQISDTQ